MAIWLMVLVVYLVLGLAVTAGFAICTRSTPKPWDQDKQR